MANSRQKTAVSVLSTSVVSHDRSSILVEAGGFEPMRWFLKYGRCPEAEEDEDEPPQKRRKTNDDKINTVQPELPDHVQLFRVSIDLYFPKALDTRPAEGKVVHDDADFPDSQSIFVIPSAVEQSDDSMRLQLASSCAKGPVIMIETNKVLPQIFDLLCKSIVWSKRRPERPKRGICPATFGNCTLTRCEVATHMIVRFDASLCWRSGVSAFPAGVPKNRHEKHPEYDQLLQLFPDVSRDEVGRMQPWTPRDFYDCLHVPQKNGNFDGDVYDNVLDGSLYPFQRRTVSWMLQREGAEFKDQEIQSIPRAHQPRDSIFWKKFQDVNGKPCYVNHLQGIISHKISEEEHQMSGGILAEEMGLGKTVELMALLSLHKRPDSEPAHVYDDDGVTQLKTSRATLIVMPFSILQQWKSELSMHAPSLKVLHYEGISKNRTADDLVSQMTTDFDVVLVTYQTLSKELHYTEDPPKRFMRTAPKYERMRSPLVGIKWWRICLDEAQMVELGVTAAARVVRRLARKHSWAVSGTPLRKNVQDLHGLLIFLRYKPLDEDVVLWNHLIKKHRHLFRQIFGKIALRHTKVRVREELNLPPQKRVVITVSFSAVEQQHYSTLFNEMCEDVGVRSDGAPADDKWDPENPRTVEFMRNWLVRLRQTCLHPQVGGRNRKALGRRQGPLRTVAEVLEVMIEQNEINLRVEERAVLASQLLRAHIVGNAGNDEHRSEKALEIYLVAEQKSIELVKDARKRLAETKSIQGEKSESEKDTDDEDSASESTPVLGKLRNSLRSALQLQHSCTFFVATAYFQIKTNETLTTPESERFKDLENKEMALYENAKLLRKEILKDSARQAESFMRRIEDMEQKGEITTMPQLKDLGDLGGIESRRIVSKSYDLFDVLREQAEVIVQWREKMAEHLRKTLVDEDEGKETTGDEYEDSTKLQDELYAYFDAFKALHADMNTFVNGEDATLTDHEVTMSIRACKRYLDPNVADEFKNPVHAPQLTLELLGLRNKFRGRKAKVGSVRGLIQEARTLETSLQRHEGGSRGAERLIVQRHVTALQLAFNSYTKALSGLEKEVDLFRDTQNQRLEFYRQLQELSDAVKPHKDELDETLDLDSLNAAVVQEEQRSNNLSQMRTKKRFLLHLRAESGPLEAPKICVICQGSFENGVLTVCGHQYCKECIQHWWSQHRTCPVCKRKLATVDLHDITYKPQELRAQEEVHPETSLRSETLSSPSRTSIYSDIDSHLMQEIKSIDLPSSYGTKIDTLGRHLRWIREHDPGAKSIVFSQYSEFLNVLSAALKDFKIRHVRFGESNAAEKFKHDPSVDCLLLDAKSNSSGLTLVNATHVFICEPLMQTAIELQAVARVHRIGQTRPTTIWMYLINDTVEEAIYDISVARRLTHLQSQQANKTQRSQSAALAPLQENAIDAANSEELQAASISKLLDAEKGAGEVVRKDDLWQCLFGKAQKTSAKGTKMEAEADRHLRAEAAQIRKIETVVGGLAISS